MYPHRPDLLSLSFGLLYLFAGLAVLVFGATGLFADWRVVVAAVALASGAGVIGSLATGDVHRRAAERRAAAAIPPPPAADPFEVSPILDDPLFGPPIDPDALDRAYRETFGEDDDPDRRGGGSAGEGAADGTAR